MTEVLTVVAAPDSFKGSLTARQAADAVAAGVRLALGDAAAVTTVPMADGGEGTLDALLDAWQGDEVEVEVHDAIGRPRTARLGLSSDGDTAIIEAAEANGLPHVRDVGLRPLEATTIGVGELARAALDRGVTQILLCIGGSATTDGGAGVLHGLGARLLDGAGADVHPGGGDLHRVARLDLDDLHPRARDVSWRIAVDVDNPLVGPRGAAAVFGPQKGADPEQIAALDDGLRHLATVLAEVTGADLTALMESPGTGAAGGLPVSLVSVLGATTVPGVRLVGDAIGLEEILSNADLVITGEGRLDSQSLHGKVIDGIRGASPATAAVVVIAGQVRLSAAEIFDAGLTAAHSIDPGAASEAELYTRTADLVTDTAAAVCRTFAHGRGLS